MRLSGNLQEDQPERRSKPRFHFQQKDVFHKAISLGREIIYTRIGLAITLLASAFVIYDVTRIGLSGYAQGDFRLMGEQSVFLSLICLLIYGNVLYQLTRIGYMKRLIAYKPEPRATLNKLFHSHSPLVTFLIPSYKEETRIILQSLLSTALQEYPKKRVVLLVDDPAFPKKEADRLALAAARELPGQVQELLSVPLERARHHLTSYWERKHTGETNPILECFHLCEAYDMAAEWFEEQARSIELADHADRLFVHEVLEKPAAEYRKLAENLFQATIKGTVSVDESQMLYEYRRMCSRFHVELTSFERKRYKNLSHEPNKAMNLNSYITLLGKNFAETEKGGDLYLTETNDEQADLRVPASPFVVTLDADSFLASDYALRLVHFMQKPENHRIAVTQTPYSAIPGAPNEIERIAGATTDIQYLIHQGFTEYGATYWVGANALLRTAALKDIELKVTERGFPISKFIQDRTVIEDTESSIDLVAKGWKLYNYPRRLSYSATPPDFGSLIIQRCRWANGGLIILPKLLKYLFSRPFRADKAKEGFMRFHYLFSIAAVNISVAALLLYPFESNLMDFWLPLTAIPYYFFYGRDLLQAGYKKRDLYKVYAINLLLIPINLAGVFKSIQQIITGRTIPFKRTPKVMGRTTAPASYILAEYAIFGFCVSGVVMDVASARWLHAAFAFFNASFLYLAVKEFIGFRNANSDLAAGFRAKWKRSKNRCRKFWGKCVCPDCVPEALTSPDAV